MGHLRLEAELPRPARRQSVELVARYRAALHPDRVEAPVERDAVDPRRALARLQARGPVADLARARVLAREEALGPHVAAGDLPSRIAPRRADRSPHRSGPRSPPSASPRRIGPARRHPAALARAERGRDTRSARGRGGRGARDTSRGAASGAGARRHRARVRAQRPSKPCVWHEDRHVSLGRFARSRCARPSRYTSFVIERHARVSPRGRVVAPFRPLIGLGHGLGLGFDRTITRVTDAHQGNHSRGTFCHAVGRRGSPSGRTREPTNSACSYTLPIDRAMLSRSMSLTMPLLVAL
jgi:hypothetical protein